MFICKRGQPSPVLDFIFKNKKITDYLEKKGHSPVKMLSAGRIAYLCPFPDHVETKPSFVVWTNSEYENFYCFGCQRSYNIINLVSEMEGISYKNALKILSEGLEITLDDSIDSELEMINKELSNPISDDLFLNLYSISSLCRSYADSVGHNSSELGIIDNLYSVVDKCILECNFDEMSEILQHLPDTLRLRREKFEQKKLESQRAI